ncbi:MAG: FHIPEP family type III secretion protein [Myxococcota bacterium]|nr:FHIPEP family type III secretion protein [Myxococcota bacterium]
MSESPLERLLRGLDFPPSAAARLVSEHRASDGADRLAALPPALVTPEMARLVWVGWRPEASDRIDDPGFLDAFARLCRDCLAMGFRLDRLREPSERLLSQPERTDWMACLEDVVDECGLRILLNPDAHARWQSQGSAASDKVYEDLFWKLGLVVPPARVNAEPSLTPPRFRIEWNDLQLPAWSGVLEDRVLVNDTVERLDLLNLEGETATNPLDGSECATIASDYAEIAEQAGLTVWDSQAYFAQVLERVVTGNAGAFVNRSMIDLLLFQLDQVAPATVAQARQRIPRDLLVQSLRGLLAEEISIRDLPRILEEMLVLEETAHVDLSKYIVFEGNRGAIYSDRATPSELAPQAYVDMLRTALRRYISHKYTRGQSTLIVYLLDPAIERRLGEPAALTEEERAELLQAVRVEVGSLPATTQKPVILTSLNVRRRVREEIQLDHPHLAVLSYQELSPDMNIQPIARISLD